MLDITQSSQTLGKPAMSDFKEGKTTLPYIHLYQVLNDTDKQKLKSMHKKTLDESELLWIKDNMKKHKIIEKSIQYAKSLGQDALMSIKQEDNMALENIIKDMIERKF